MLPSPTARLRFRAMTDDDLDEMALRGQGLGSEAAAAVRDAARAAGIAHLVAIIRPDNLPSQGVATKIGLVLERRVVKGGGDVLVFGADL